MPVVLTGKPSVLEQACAFEKREVFRWLVQGFSSNPACTFDSILGFVVLFKESKRR
jgi:hypothetical protein